MIDFTKEKEIINKFKGSEKKKTIEYRGKLYLLKFPDPTRERKLSTSYINNVFSEYLGCKIYESIGIEVQKVYLGFYTIANGERKYVCACEDFTDEKTVLYEYKNFSLSNVEVQSTFDTELNEVLETIEKNPMIIDKEIVKRRFWDMFIVDAFIGNADRHTGNWGFLCKENTIQRLAPVYDCGSCLNPLWTDDILEKIPDVEYKNLAINNYSCYRNEGKKILTTQYIGSMRNKDCNAAIKRIVPKIDLDMIGSIIDGMSCLSDIRKSFYKKILAARKKWILDRPCELLTEGIQKKQQEEKNCGRNSKKNKSNSNR